MYALAKVSWHCFSIFLLIGSPYIRFLILADSFGCKVGDVKNELVKESRSFLYPRYFPTENCSLLQVSLWFLFFAQFIALMVVVKQRPSLPICDLSDFELFLECHFYPQVSHCKTCVRVLRLILWPRIIQVLQNSKYTLVKWSSEIQNQWLRPPKVKRRPASPSFVHSIQKLPWGNRCLHYCFSVSKRSSVDTFKTIGAWVVHVATNCTFLSWKRAWEAALVISWWHENL